MMQSKRLKGWLALAAWLFALGLVWLVWLPSHAQRPPVRRHLQWLDERGIDPSAMYYTELEVMEDILARQRAHGMWRPR